MPRTRSLALIVLIGLGGCAPVPQAARAALCPAGDLSHLVGQPLVDVAARDGLGPVRHLPAEDPAGEARPDRLTLRSDGAGRISAAWCG